ncbi:hypothetical protein V1514DRAFT_327286, partial [Lipomyces japonicus]|uniref:uncharacterized protein n=1 Tax=Lipomyces japonicus TaxID=56871 RepID=UPI0034CD73DA
MISEVKQFLISRVTRRNMIWAVTAVYVFLVTILNVILPKRLRAAICAFFSMHKEAEKQDSLSPTQNEYKLREALLLLKFGKEIELQCQEIAYTKNNLLQLRLKTEANRKAHHVQHKTEHREIVKPCELSQTERRTPSITTEKRNLRVNVSVEMLQEEKFNQKLIAVKAKLQEARQTMENLHLCPESDLQQQQQQQQQTPEAELRLESALELKLELETGLDSEPQAPTQTREILSIAPRKLQQMPPPPRKISKLVRFDLPPVIAANYRKCGQLQIVTEEPSLLTEAKKPKVYQNRVFDRHGLERKPQGRSQVKQSFLTKTKKEETNEQHVNRRFLRLCRDSDLDSDSAFDSFYESVSRSVAHSDFLVRSRLQLYGLNKLRQRDAEKKEEEFCRKLNESKEPIAFNEENKGQMCPFVLPRPRLPFRRFDKKHQQKEQTRGNKTTTMVAPQPTNAGQATSNSSEEWMGHRLPQNYSGSLKAELARIQDRKVQNLRKLAARKFAGLPSWLTNPILKYAEAHAQFFLMSEEELYWASEKYFEWFGLIFVDQILEASKGEISKDQLRRANMIASEYSLTGFLNDLKYIKENPDFVRKFYALGWKTPPPELLVKC